MNIIYRKTWKSLLDLLLHYSLSIDTKNIQYFFHHLSKYFINSFIYLNYNLIIFKLFISGKSIFNYYLIISKTKRYQFRHYVHPGCSKFLNKTLDRAINEGNDFLVKSIGIQDRRWFEIFQLSS